jgi:hypothetical protein
VTIVVALTMALGAELAVGVNERAPGSEALPLVATGPWRRVPASMEAIFVFVCS